MLPLALKRIVRRWRRPWSLWKLLDATAYNGLASLGCYIVGWLVTTATSPLAFSRSGALATAIAIVFTLYNFTEKVRNSEQSARELFEQIMRQFPLTGEASMREIDRKLKENTRRITSAATIAHTIILVIATLVWGFGDLATDCIKGVGNDSTSQMCTLIGNGVNQTMRREFADGLSAVSR